MIADPAAIVSGCGGKWTGNSSMCFCPAHDNSRTPALSVSRTRDGRPLVHCHAGCEQMAVITALRQKGLWPDKGELVRDPSAPHRLTVAHDPGGLDTDALKRRALARDLWAKSQPIAGTIAETYLRHRGVRSKLPEVLRFHPNLPHRESRRPYPCLVAAIIDGSNRVCAVQRTWLLPDGSDRIRPADGSKGKMTLGPMTDGAVRLGQPTAVLGLAEGIETALSAKQLYAVAVWATLSAHRLGAVTIPEGVQQVWIFADAGQVGLKEARAAVDHYSDQGYRCLIQMPDEGYSDHNDVLRAGRAA
jgi:putative DNA primase/helicase